MNENLEWLLEFDHKWYVARRSGYDCQEEYCDELCEFCIKIGISIDEEKKRKDFIDFTEDLLEEAFNKIEKEK
jgi:hypothetical protein